ncbi:MAG: hypothetical protein H7321_00345, partial [Bacteroidia bacterium]|nr:hypothetical protein [Bacteroidia bacterium]
MKFKLKKLKKPLFITLIVIVVLMAVIIIFISPISKYMIEKYDKKFTNREITLDWAYVNPFTGYIHLDNLKVYEENTDSIFLAMSGLTVNFEVSKLLSKTYEIGKLKL